MEIYFAVCAGISTLCFVLITAFLIGTLIQVQRTAQAFERLARALNGRMDTVFEIAEHILGAFQSKWLKAVEFAVKGFQSFRRAAAAGPREPENNGGV
jgi:hypothetical protein